MPRKPRPINEAWQHSLIGKELVDAFLACGEAAIQSGVVPSAGPEAVSLSLSFEDLSGTLAEVRSSITQEDIDALQSGAFRLGGAPAPPAVAPRPGVPVRAPNPAQLASINLNVNAVNHTVNLNIQNPAETAAARKFREFVRSQFPPVTAVATPQTPRIAVRPSANDSPPTMGGLRAGAEIDHYRLTRRLGSGFSGEVWQVEVISSPPGVRLDPGQVVAMKQYFPHVLTRSADSLRITREWHVASEVRHENLVTVHDLVISPSRPFGAFLVMEYIAGETLKSKIPRRGFDWQQVVTVGRQLASALTELHGFGALHRDIKPANIMVIQGDALLVKLLDLGIVSLVGERGLTEASVFLGSKHTSSPEQLFGEELDERADIYALGATLYHCYHGRALYEDVGPATAIVRAMMEKPMSCALKEKASPSEIALVEFLNRCISIDPSRRPSTAKLCLETLEGFSVP